jgi:SAM-dependent methyltransferase
MSQAELDQAEIERSAEEATEITIGPPNRDHLKRYLNPPSDTAFPLEYAFWLLGEVRGKAVLDFGCGSGENIVPIVERGARVIGIDISPELIELARLRLALAKLEATVQVGSAYDTGLPDSSVDVIFCIALVHHLNVECVCKEMCRVLARGGKIILSEPIRFSPSYARLRNLLTARSSNVSEYEHPLTRAEFAAINQSFKADGTRYFRLPFVPLLSPIIGARHLFKMDRLCLRTFPATSQYATIVVSKLGV